MTRKLSTPMFNLARRLSDLLQEAESCFKPGAKVTLVVRNPMVADGDVVMGNDDAEEVIAAINRMKNRPATVNANEYVLPA